MCANVTMNLSDNELALIEKLRNSLKLSTDTGVVVQSLRIAGLLAEVMKNGKQIAVLDFNGRPEAMILIPRLSKTI